MNTGKKIGFLLIGFLLVGFALGLIVSPSSKNQQRKPLNLENTQASSSPQQTPTTLPTSYQTVKVTRVVDGDTIEIEGGQKVRYIGMNTPETVDPRKPVECFGRQASEKNKELVEGKEVRLEKDISETDKYGRLLRYVYVGDIFVNDYLVRQGYAYATSYPPDVKYQEQLRQAQEEAQAKNLGLWQSCNVTSTTPSPTAAAISSQIESQTSGACVIKGNINSKGEKIYHMPGQRYYDKTVIDESSGERWFCTEDEAVQAGWRKSKV